MGREPRINDDDRLEPQTQAKAELVPPTRKPPTAVGAATSPWPPQPPHGPGRRTGGHPVLSAVRATVGALLDAADALAGTIHRALGWRA
ncbi:MAG TPA: hypothetical protein VJN62_11225 [Gemmatimonadales bacterium]|nr:hypothetical protein [Gemmatimonadales bacterium]